MRDGYPLRQVVLKRGQTILWLLISMGLGFILTKTTTVQPQEVISPGSVLSQEIAGVPAGEIYGPIKIGQTFISPANGLYRVDILLATYARENDREVIFHLRRAPGEEDLATVRFNAAGVKDNVFFTFTFPPIPDSRGQEFYFFLESPHSEPGNAITVWGVTGNVYPEGRSYRNHRPTGGEVAFRVYAGRPSLSELLLEFLAQNPLQIIMFSL